MDVNNSYWPRALERLTTTASITSAFVELGSGDDAGALIPIQQLLALPLLPALRPEHHRGPPFQGVPLGLLMLKTKPDTRRALNYSSDVTGFWKR